MTIWESYPGPVYLLGMGRHIRAPILLGLLKKKNALISFKLEKKFILFYFFKDSSIFVFFFLAALGLRCCVWAFSSCSKRGLLFSVVRGLLIAVASLVAEHGL